MIEDNAEQKIERKARIRAVISGVLTSTIILFLLLLIPFFTIRHEEPLTAVFSSALFFSLFFSPLGGLAGSIGVNQRHVSSGAAISAIIFCTFGLFTATLFAQNSPVPELFISLFCCAFAVMGALCGGVGAMFGRTCREFEGKRFWPQFSIAELMTFVFLIAILLSCLVTLRQIIGKAS
ncbi:MAG: hypothetical protein ABSA26_00620 [Thermoguttaceae bacterium]|jgi:hypothetical protein